ncbi:hypothetical protein REPUB_Repub06bG0120500 [Reevesia pubescens]
MEQYPEEKNSMQSLAAANGSSLSDEEDGTSIEEYFESFPEGYRFVPTDEELVEEYLKKKVNGEPLPPNRIRVVNLYSHDPPQLIEQNKSSEETEWYFFTPRAKKYPNGSRPQRSTPNGYWRPTGTDKAIPHEDPVACKKTLDFYAGKHPLGSKTDWKMHEYILKDTDNNPQNNTDRAKDYMTLDEWVLCKIYKKKEKNGGDEASTSGTQPPTVNLTQNSEASLMVGNNTNEFEDQNSKSSQPTIESIFLMADSDMFKDRNWNASQPTFNIALNNEASLNIAGYNNIVSEDQNWNASQPTVNVALNNEASLNIAGYNNIVSEYQNWNASQPTVNVALNNEASLNTAGYNNIVSEDQNWNAFQPTVNLALNNGASLMAGYNNIVFEDQNRNASQPIPNQGPMHEEAGTFQSNFMYNQPNFK